MVILERKEIFVTIYIFYLLVIYVLFLFFSLIRTSQNDSYIDNQEKVKSHWVIFLFMSFILLFTLMGFRGEYIGADTSTYRKSFPIYSKLDWAEILENNTNYEIGYCILMKIAASVSSDPAWIIIVTSAIFMILCFNFIKSNCENYFLTIILFISVGPYLFAFNGIRQSLAGAFCLVGWMTFQKRKFIKASLLFLLAVLFHTTAIIFPVLLIILYLVPHNKKCYFIVVVACTAFVIFLRPAMNFILRFFPIYDLRYGRGRWNIAGARGMIVVWILIVALCFYQCAKTNWTDIQNRRKFEVIFFSILYITFHLAGQMFDGLQRMTVYFSPFLILLFEDSLKLFEGRSRQMYHATLIVVFSILFIRSSMTTQYADYRFFWEG